MTTQQKIAFIGGDERMLAAARRCAAQGLECAVWGNQSTSGEYGHAVRCADWSGAMREADAIILPLPASLDGIRINVSPGETVNAHSPELRFTHLLDAIHPNQQIFGGRLPPAFKTAAEERGISLTDYSENELFQIANARLTAEGALALALQELPVSILGLPTAVIGYGRIGKCLSSLLAAVGAHVTVAARKRSDLVWAEQSGYSTLQIEQREGECSLCALGNGCRVIFNTAPHWLMTEQVLRALHPKTLIIDLASAPGGVDPQAAATVGIRVIRALSLPGKCAPITAGEIIADTVLTSLRMDGGGRA